MLCRAKTIMAGSILGFSLPNFWQGLMLIMIFAVMLRLAARRRARGPRCEIPRHPLQPVHLRRAAAHLILPAINLALFKTSLVIRLCPRRGARGDCCRTMSNSPAPRACGPWAGSSLSMC
jgi:ABC-type dipeptide/oligopeptide/nickel transport system permease component